MIPSVSTDREEVRANAVLMTSAPELLEALKELRQFVVDNINKLPDSETVRFNALKAINKAMSEIPFNS